jgi:tRNA nucleotidyltransferase/poly(A) polymerase
MKVDITALPLSKLKAEGYEAYIVRGAVRDLLLGLPLQDIDLTVFGGDYRNYASLLARRFRTSAVCFKDNVRLPLGKLHIDISAPRGADIAADLALRDFTVNNLAVSFDGELLGDPKDIYAKKVIPAHPRALLDDPLRILRAFRQAAFLGFDLTEEFFSLLPAATPLLPDVAKERVCYELKLLSAARPDEKTCEIYGYMDSYGVFEAIFGFRPNLPPLFAALKAAYGRLTGDTLFSLFLAAVYSGGSRDFKKETKALMLSNLQHNAADNILRFSADIFGAAETAAKLALWEAENLGLKEAVIIFGQTHFGESAVIRLAQDNRKGDIISGNDILAAFEAPAGAWVKTVLNRTKAALSFGEIEGKTAALEYAGKIYDGIKDDLR